MSITSNVTISEQVSKLFQKLSIAEDSFVDRSEVLAATHFLAYGEIQGVETLEIIRKTYSHEQGRRVVTDRFSFLEQPVSLVDHLLDREEDNAEQRIIEEDNYIILIENLISEGNSPQRVRLVANSIYGVTNLEFELSENLDENAIAKLGNYLNSLTDRAIHLPRKYSHYDICNAIKYKQDLAELGIEILDIKVQIYSERSVSEAVEMRISNYLIDSDDSSLLLEKLFEDNSTPLTIRDLENKEVVVDMQRYAHTRPELFPRDGIYVQSSKSQTIDVIKGIGGDKILFSYGGPMNVGDEGHIMNILFCE
jgi:hypothetical protein